MAYTAGRIPSGIAPRFTTQLHPQSLPMNFFILSEDKQQQGMYQAALPRSSQYSFTLNQ